MTMTEIIYKLPTDCPGCHCWGCPLAEGDRCDFQDSEEDVPMGNLERFVVIKEEDGISYLTHAK